MNPLQVSQDPSWYRWIDGVVILSIGVVIGMVAAYSVLISQMQAVEQVIPVRLKANSGGKVLESSEPGSTGFFEIEES